MKNTIMGLLLLSSSLLPTLAVQAQDVDVPNNLTMRDTTDSTVGNILKGPDIFIHNFGDNNTFIGKGAGNLTMTGDSNTASGVEALQSNSEGSFNTASGRGALQSNTSGSFNTASGRGALQSNTTGSQNTATGFFALQRNTEGLNNTASGYFALASNTTGHDNTATGVGALSNNTTGGNFNTASGSGALQSNTTGASNTANGASALQTNTEGFNNTASGVSALASNTTGSRNTVSGAGALLLNSTGSFNTASGDDALNQNTTGSNNAAVGDFALNSNHGGSSNTAVGFQALFQNSSNFADQNTAVGAEALAGANGDRNIAIGYRAGFALAPGEFQRNNIYIGSPGASNDANTIRIGVTDPTDPNRHLFFFAAGVRANAVFGGLPVDVSDSGQLGFRGSSRRFKEEVSDIGDASDDLQRLRPVRFYYKQAQQSGPRQVQYGLIAEEVAEVYPDLVAYDRDGQPEAVRYHFIDVLLLKEVQKQHRRQLDQQQEIVKQQQAIEKLQILTSENAELKARLEALERLVKQTQTASRESAE